MSARADAAAGAAALPALVLVDLDGTLIDSAPDLAVAADRMLAAIGRQALGERRVRGYVGNGIERLVHRCLTGMRDRDAPQTEFEPAYRRFVEYYRDENGRHSRVYDGVTQGLDRLAAQGVALGCVTNKAARFSEPLLERFDLLDRFAIVVSGDSAAAKKPDPAPLLHACEALGVGPADALLVGDSGNDVRAARAAGMPVVCVSYGYNHGRDIRDEHPDCVIDSLADLGETLPRLDFAVR